MASVNSKCFSEQQIVERQCRELIPHHVSILFDIPFEEFNSSVSPNTRVEQNLLQAFLWLQTFRVRSSSPVGFTDWRTIGFCSHECRMIVSPPACLVRPDSTLYGAIQVQPVLEQGLLQASRRAWNSAIPPRLRSSQVLLESAEYTYFEELRAMMS